MALLRWTATGALHAPAPLPAAPRALAFARRALLTRRLTFEPYGWAAWPLPTLPLSLRVFFKAVASTRRWAC